MIGHLAPAEIESLLHTEAVARIGCHSNGHTYIVPVTYAYDGQALTGYSADGLKLWMMRENPRVCVEVDRIESMTNWKSVIATGHFEELAGAEADRSLELLKQKLQPLMPSATAMPSFGVDPHARELNRKKSAVYRIVLETKTGRYEKR